MTGTKEEEINISIPDLIYTIWEFRLLVMLLVMIGGAAGFFLTGGNTLTYQTRASMLVTAKTGTGSYAAGEDTPRMEDMNIAQNLAKTVQLLASSNRVMDEVLDRAQIDVPEELREQIRRSITVTQEEGTSFLYLTLAWEKPQEAASLLNCLMEVLPEVMQEVLDIGSVNVIDTAGQVTAAGDNRMRNMGLGLLAGLAFGCLLGLFYYLYVPKVRGSGSLEDIGVEVLGKIPLSQRREMPGAFLDEGKHPPEFIEEYGRLAAVFRYLAEGKSCKIAAVTSSIAGEGKTTVAYNLALRLTEMGCKVLLLDFDFKKGVLYRLAKEHKPSDGTVRSVPRDSEHLDEVLEQMYNGIYTIQGFHQNAVTCTDAKLFQAIRRIGEDFDFILIDTPPVGTMADVQLLRGLLDTSIFVCRQDVVRLQIVKESVQQLEKAGIPILGGVLNTWQRRGS